MNPEDKNTQQQTIDRIAAQQGQQPQAPGQPPSQQVPSPQTPMSPPKQNETPPTDAEKAAAAGSPQTEGDKAKAEAILYDIEFGEGDTRQLTPQQIKSTFERYRDLNFQNAQMKPVNQVVNAFMKKYGANPAQAAQALINMEKAFEKNPQLGREAGGDANSGQQQKQELTDDVFKKWEEDNAAALPPGYKEMSGQMRQMMQMNQQMQQMLAQVIGGTQGVANAANQQVKQADNMRGQAMQQQIANNLNRVQQALGLGDDKAHEFMSFAAERGYTLDDFIDPGLTAKVAQDYKNNAMSGEYDRLKQLSERRQAFTGSIEGTPSSGGTPPTDSPEQADIDRLFNKYQK